MAIEWSKETVSSSPACRIAFEHVREMVSDRLRLPFNVFVGAWAHYLFFDSDWMRDADFVDELKVLLDAESGECACIINIDSPDVESSTFFVRRETGRDLYKARLAGNTPQHGWLHTMERLACASDSAEWCMYCEPNNETGVIALRQPSALYTYSTVLERFHAEPISTALAKPSFLGMSLAAESGQWRKSLLSEYSPKST